MLLHLVSIICTVTASISMARTILTLKNGMTALGAGEDCTGPKGRCTCHQSGSSLLTTQRMSPCSNLSPVSGQGRHLSWAGSYEKNDRTNMGFCAHKVQNIRDGE